MPCCRSWSLLPPKIRQTRRCAVTGAQSRLSAKLASARNPTAAGSASQSANVPGRVGCQTAGSPIYHLTRCSLAPPTCLVSDLQAVVRKDLTRLEPGALRSDLKKARRQKPAGAPVGAPVALRSARRSARKGLASGHRILTTSNGQNHFEIIAGSKVLDDYYNTYLRK
jgi:hypothetical protein